MPTGFTFSGSSGGGSTVAGGSRSSRGGAVLSASRNAHNALFFEEADYEAFERVIEEGLKK